MDQPKDLEVTAIRMALLMLVGTEDAVIGYPHAEPDGERSQAPLDRCRLRKQQLAVETNRT